MSVWYRTATDKELAEALCEVEEGLTAWEVEFVDSVARQVASGRLFTPRQRSKAEQIMEKVERRSN